MKTILAVALCLTGCGSLKYDSMGPGCHYVACGDMLDGYDGHRCNIVVDGRVINNVASGAEALDFIKHNNLKTCETAP